MSGTENGNGFNPVEISVTNDAEFKAGMVKYMQLLVDRTDCLPAVKKKVERHEQIVKTGKWLGIPLLAVLHAGLKAFFNRLGW